MPFMDRGIMEAPAIHGVNAFEIFFLYGCSTYYCIVDLSLSIVLYATCTDDAVRQQPTVEHV